MVNLFYLFIFKTFFNNKIILKPTAAIIILFTIVNM